MAEVVDGVERAQFGETAVTRDNFEGMWRRVLPLLGERFGVLLLALLVAASCGEPRGDWEYSPSGRAGVIAFLGERGFTVRERLSAVAKLGKHKPADDRPAADGKPAPAKATQLVLLPGAQMGDDDWQAVKTWLDQGGRSLVVAGGKRPLPPWLGARIVEAETAPAEAITPDDADSKRWGPLKARVPGGSRVEAESGARPFLARKPSVYATERWLDLDGGKQNHANRAAEAIAPGEHDDEDDDEEDEAEDDGKSGDGGEEVPAGAALSVPEGDERKPSRVVVLADDSLLRNASLLVADNAALLEAMLRDGGTAVELVGDLAGLVAKNPVESVERGRLGPALLQLAGFLVLFFVCQGARFGRPVPEPRSERRAFVEHVRALGLHYARARAERVALGALGAYAIERLRERCGLHVDRSLSGLAEAVAARTGRPVGDLMRMFLEARDAGKGVPADGEARDLETAWQMCKLLEETGGTGGHQRIQSHV
jgi:hypothetical protein